ncbi:RNase adapter RapZ, partial [bacterium]
DIKLMINIISFGYKYGLPLESDIVIDTRFLPNPFYENTLKMYTGNEKKVRDFVLARKSARIFVSKIIDFLSFLIPRFIKEGKSYLTIALGCTGGRHRSVVIANALKKHFDKKKLDVRIVHRDILR